MTDSPHPVRPGEPAGLSEEEIKALFHQMRDGDESAADAILQGNSDWLYQLVNPLAEQSEIPFEDLSAAAEAGVREAISNYDKPLFRFRPDDRLQGGYAIWWVRLKLAKLAESHGYAYNSAANELTRQIG